MTVSLARDDSEVSVRIEDDGCGFDTAVRTNGLGLLGASERAAAVGGWMLASYAPGHGTVIRMVIPMKDVMTTEYQGCI